MTTCEAVVLAATRWEPAAYCDMEAVPGDDYCQEHAEFFDEEGRAERLWEALTGR